MTPGEFASAVDDAFAVRFGALMNADPSIPVGRQSHPGVAEGLKFVWIALARTAKGAAL